MYIPHTEVYYIFPFRSCVHSNVGHYDREIVEM